MMKQRCCCEKELTSRVRSRSSWHSSQEGAAVPCNGSPIHDCLIYSIENNSHLEMRRERHLNELPASNVIVACAKIRQDVLTVHRSARILNCMLSRCGVLIFLSKIIFACLVNRRLENMSFVTALGGAKSEERPACIDTLLFHQQLPHSAS